MVLQLTQSDGKAVMHVSITASVLPFPCSRLRWVLEWDYTHLVLVLLCIITYRVMACFMLSSRLSLCMATSMRATAPPLSALAVISMRPSHRCPCFCITADSYQYGTRSSVDNIMVLTFQTNKRGRSVKAGQIMLIENVFHLSIEVYFLITAFIL